MRHSTLAELLRAKQADGTSLAHVTIPSVTQRTLEECFQLFPLIHALVADRATLHRVTTEMIEDFAAERTWQARPPVRPRPAPPDRAAPAATWRSGRRPRRAAA